MPDAQLPVSQLPRPVFKDADPIRYTFIPNLSTPFTVQTTPGAACTIHPPNDTDPAHSIKAYADPQGVARFHLTPSAETDQLAQLVIDSVKDSTATRIPLHIRSSRTPTADMPHPPVEHPVASLPKGRALAPLSLDEALRLTDEQALARGLPLRPNPDEVPKAFHTWLRAVSSPLISVDPALINNPDVTHDKAKEAGPANFFNWSGFELDRSLRFTGPIYKGHGGVTITPPYDWVAGEWVVPAVTSEPNKKTYSCMWVGLDGDGVTDLVQAGTESDCTNFNFFFININIATYYAWTEFLPQQATEQVISGFPVSAGDRIFTEVWMGNAGSSPTLAGAFGCFLVMNLSNGYTSSIYTPIGTTKVGGTEAVWIMERPTVGGVFPDLANYGSATITSASARQANAAAHSGYIAYQGLANKQITMVNSAQTDTMSTVTPVDASSMLFTWKNFN
jgi:Peptidase A4 family